MITFVFAIPSLISYCISLSQTRYVLAGNDVRSNTVQVSHKQYLAKVNTWETATWSISKLGHYLHNGFVPFMRTQRSHGSP